MSQYAQLHSVDPTNAKVSVTANPKKFYIIYIYTYIYIYIFINNPIYVYIYICIRISKMMEYDGN